MTAPAVELKGVTKRFGPVLAVGDVDFAAAAGEIHALCGENGAGKSTLMKILYGLLRPDAGAVLVDGVPLRRHSPAQAIDRGIGMVHPHFTLVPTLTVAENLALGREPRRLGLLDLGAARAAVLRLMERFALGLAPDRLVADLSVGEQQRVEIAKVLHRGARVLVLDEPTAVLTPPEAQQLFGILRELRAAGSAVVLITHKLDEVMQVSDRVTVMRHGRVVARLETRDTTPAAIARAMVGHEIAAEPNHTGAAPSPDVAPVLAVEDLTVETRAGVLALDHVSLELRPGEILGIAGVEGNGQTELVEALAGLRPARRGRVRLGGVDLGPAGVRARFAAGLAHVPEDRHRRGLVLDLSLAENLLLGREAEVGFFGFWPGALAARAAPVLERHDVRPARPEAAARTLSGGNQQKLVVARELGRHARVILAAQPTRGVDVGAVVRIWQDLRAARAAGAAVLLVSADLQELFTLADRLLVMYRGRVAAEVDPRTTTPEEVGLHMTGAAAEATS